MIRQLDRDGRGIAWIASYPRSGNTWLRIFLHYVNVATGGLAIDNASPDDAIRTTPGAGGLPAELAEFRDRNFDGLDPIEVAKSRPASQAAYARSRDGLSLLKTHSILGTVAGVPTVNPELTVGAIYLVRNPLDVAISLRHYLGCTQAQAIAVLNSPHYGAIPRTYFETWGSWSENVHGWTSQSQPETLVLRYEDMVAQPLVALTRAVRHLRIHATPAHIVEAAQRTSFQELQKKEGEMGFRERGPNKASRFFRQGQSGQWRAALTEDEVRTVVTAHHEEMKRFGYLDDDLSRLVP
jgi:hypothetical protein